MTLRAGSAILFSSMNSKDGLVRPTCTILVVWPISPLMANRLSQLRLISDEILLVISSLSLESQSTWSADLADPLAVSILQNIQVGLYFVMVGRSHTGIRAL